MTAFFPNDTVCAVATPIGEGGIGIIKISGPNARSVADKLFHPTVPNRPLRSHQLQYGWIRDPATQDPLDEVLVSYMAAPHTYTKEDIVEINCHSGFAVLQRILALVVGAGVRLAEPGEFTRRAFLNGRIDLTQAEAVIELIRSRSEQSLKLVNRQLQGDFRRRVEAWRSRLLALQALVEAVLDFSEELEDEADGALANLVERLDHEILQPLTRALADYDSGRILKEGLTLILVGKPNVGKSSLMNGLLGKERAIVSAFPGTTRDVIEDSFLLSGIAVRILDTAGIRQEPDAIESLGIERTISYLEEADAVIWLLDGSGPLTAEDDLIFSAIRDHQFLIVMNKADLPPVVDEQAARSRYGNDSPLIRISALRSADISRLRTAFTEIFLEQPLAHANSLIIPNVRHKNCLEQALQALNRARELLVEADFQELVSVELLAAQRELSAILGEGADPDLLDHIFAQFCIGK